MLKRAAHQRFVAWLALAAMALIVLMPVVCRSMPPDAAMAGMGAGCAMGVGHADHRHHGMPHDPTARCGYCVMLTHTPVAGLGTALVLVPLYLPALTPQTIQHRSEPSVRLLSARPRGPPLFANG